MQNVIHTKSLQKDPFCLEVLYESLHHSIFIWLDVTILRASILISNIPSLPVLQADVQVLKNDKYRTTSTVPYSTVVLVQYGYKVLYKYLYL